MFEKISFFLSFFIFFFIFLVYGDVKSDIDVAFGRAEIYSNDSFQISLDQTSGAGVKSKDEYLFGKVAVQIKLVPGDSAGTVATFYFSGEGDTRDEIDLEFLGNVSGEPYILHTNIYINGKDDREQQFYLWFDPRQDYHTYTILWNPHQILLSVDDTPIRIFKHSAGKGLSYPNMQPMRLYATIWNASWATRGGQVQIDWNHAPFTASYSEYKADGCVWSESTRQSTCSQSKPGWWNQTVDANAERQIKWVQMHYMIYNYCNDTKRFPQGLPPECSL